jgi:hypothetical protein
LSFDVVGPLSESLQASFAVICHFHTFSVEALWVLLSFSDMRRAFDMLWNYLFVRPVMTLLSNYVRLSLFAAQIPDLLPAAVLYNHCWWKRQKPPLEDSPALLRFVRSRSKIS